MNPRDRRTERWLLALMPVISAAAVATTTGGPSFRGKKGIISEAILKDMHSRMRKKGCDLSPEQWHRLCYEPIVLEGINTPAGCTEGCLPDSSETSVLKKETTTVVEEEE